MQEFIPLISEVGFPIIITLYLLHRIAAKLDNIVQSIQNLPYQMKESEYQDRKIM
ncbi:YvrJ family protein [Mesobacillus persicus]|uniref:YvrJ family protein n=1 Tax=Mesobacillus persicus TaxID=930146 RepID=UPI000B8467CB|nr:YvrJ family protein [Mesobacillus persicus]